MGRVLIDISVWINFFRNGQSNDAKKVKNLLDHDSVCMTTIIRAEILPGARNESQFRLLQDNLSAIPLLEEPDKFWDLIAYDRFRLARRGIQVSLSDLSIAVLAIPHQSPLFTKDRLFTAIRKVLPLQLYR